MPHPIAIRGSAQRVSRSRVRNACARTRCTNKQTRLDAPHAAHDGPAGTVRAAAATQVRHGIPPMRYEIPRLHGPCCAAAAQVRHDRRTWVWRQGRAFGAQCGARPQPYQDRAVPGPHAIERRSARRMTRSMGGIRRRCTVRTAPSGLSGAATADGLRRCQAEEDGGSPERKAGSSIQRKKLDRMRQKLKKVWHCIPYGAHSPASTFRAHARKHARSLCAQSDSLVLTHRQRIPIGWRYIYRRDLLAPPDRLSAVSAA